MKTRNVTLSLPVDLLKKLKIVAAKQDTSMSALLTRAMRQIVAEEDDYAKAARGFIEDMRKGYNLGTHGKISWTRDELHER